VSEVDGLVILDGHLELQLVAVHLDLEKTVVKVALGRIFAQVYFVLCVGRRVLISDLLAK
jgi:hypothetical protein